MRAWLIPVAIAFLAAGCASRQIDPSRPMSRDFPLSYIDLAEIKIGSEEHQEVLREYKIYHQPELQQYIANIGFRLAAVSERPYLPYQFYILDDNKVDAFSLGGGYVYVTKGLLEYVETEAELASVLAHEIAHIALGAHTPDVDRPQTKKQLFVRALSTSAGVAAGAAGSFVGGPAGGIASGSVERVVDQVVPQIRKRFHKHEELTADRSAVFYMRKMNYDPRELLRFLDKISRIRIAEIDRYIDFLNSHPPYQERREQLVEIMEEINFKKTSYELRNERFVSIRMMTMQLDNVDAGTSTIVETVQIETKPPVT